MRYVWFIFFAIFGTADIKHFGRSVCENFNSFIMDSSDIILAKIHSVVLENCHFHFVC